MDTYADDLPALVEALDLKNAIHIGRHGTKRVAKAVPISAVPPLMLKTASNPGGLPKEAFDGLRAGVHAYRSQFFNQRGIAGVHTAQQSGVVVRCPYGCFAFP